MGFSIVQFGVAGPRNAVSALGAFGKQGNATKTLFVGSMEFPTPKTGQVKEAASDISVTCGILNT